MNISSLLRLNIAPWKLQMRRVLNLLHVRMFTILSNTKIQNQTTLYCMDTQNLQISRNWKISRYGLLVCVQINKFAATKQFRGFVPLGHSRGASMWNEMMKQVGS